MSEAYLYFRESWEKALRTKAYPNFLRHIVRIEAKEFVSMVWEANEKSAEDLVDSVLSGDAYVLKSAHSEQGIDDLRQRLVEWRNERPQDSFDKILEGCPDSHKIYDVKIEGPNVYQTWNHTHGFYRWKGDSLGIFAMISPIGRR